MRHQYDHIHMPHKLKCTCTSVPGIIRVSVCITSLIRDWQRNHAVERGSEVSTLLRFIVGPGMDPCHFLTHSALVVMSPLSLVFNTQSNYFFVVYPINNSLIRKHLSHKLFQWISGNSSISYWVRKLYSTFYILHKITPTMYV